MEGNCSRPVFPSFFTLLACKNYFWGGALPPMVGWSFLRAGSSPPNLDGPDSTAIWANCWVGNNDSDLSTPSSCSASAYLLIISPASGGASWAGDGGGLVMRASSSPSLLCELLSLVLSTWVMPFSPFLGVTLVLAMLEFRQRKWTNGKMVSSQSCKNHVATILNF